MRSEDYEDLTFVATDKPCNSCTGGKGGNSYPLCSNDGRTFRKSDDLAEYRALRQYRLTRCNLLLAGRCADMINL